MCNVREREMKLGSVLGEFDGARSIRNLSGRGMSSNESSNGHLEDEAELQRRSATRCSKGRVPTGVVPIRPGYVGVIDRDIGKVEG